MEVDLQLIADSLIDSAAETETCIERNCKRMPAAVVAVKRIGIVAARACADTLRRPGLTDRDALVAITAACRQFKGPA